ncbi:Ger(x)C family spore germination protein [Hathewaya histolytica]|uniref:Ger(x)C family spore germination protein n=1 Tax=Hathewaya histolytica TaxID=1498 RepID=UPI003B6723B1
MIKIINLYRKNHFNKFKIISLMLCTTLLFSGCYNSEPIEKIAVIVGIVFQKDKKDNRKNHIYSEILSFDQGSNSIKGEYVEGSSFSLYEAFNISNSKISKTRVLGDELLYLINEEKAKDGIDDILDTFLRNDDRNENAFVAVTTKDVKELSTSQPRTATLSEDLYNLLYFANKANFYAKDYSIAEILKMHHQKGREIILPVIDVQDGKQALSGLAIFKNTKLVSITDLKEARLINMIRNSGVSGYLNLLDDECKEFADFSSKNKVKVNVSKENETLIYDISVGLECMIAVNTLGDNENKKTYKSRKNIEEKLNSLVEKDLNNMIKKSIEEYETDIFDLGKYALAKFGKNSGYDDFKYIKNSKINVKVNSKIISPGRNTDMNND